jgi:hypothetical protein
LINVVIPLACQWNISWINNGLCEDVTNIEECQFDGGDCCLVDQTITGFCTICLCHETGLYYTAAPGSIFYYFVVQYCFAGLFNVVIPLGCQFPISWIDDGVCDDETNTESCQFDGGDCCLDNGAMTSCTICICHETGIQATPVPGDGTYLKWSR